MTYPTNVTVMSLHKRIGTFPGTFWATLVKKMMPETFVVAGGRDVCDIMLRVVCWRVVKSCCSPHHITPIP